MRKHKNKIYTLDDVRRWRELKKDELDLEILKFHAEKEELKSVFKKGLAEILLYEIIFSAAENLMKSLIRSAFTKSEKNPEDQKENNSDE